MQDAMRAKIAQRTRGGSFVMRRAFRCAESAPAIQANARTMHLVWPSFSFHSHEIVTRQQHKQGSQLSTELKRLHAEHSALQEEFTQYKQQTVQTHHKDIHLLLHEHQEGIAELQTINRQLEHKYLPFG